MVDETFDDLRREYLSDRYMAHLTNKELERRARDVYINCIDLNDEIKPIPTSLKEYGGYFWRQFVHIQEEHKQRFGSTELAFQTKDIRKLLKSYSDSPLYMKILNSRINYHDYAGKPFLYKYGNHSYLKKTLSRGKFRISPATRYRDSSLNYEIRDKELELILNIPPSKYRIRVYDGKTNKSKGEMKINDNKMNIKSLTNYYVVCLSTKLSPRFFINYHYDSCLVIKNPADFIKKLLTNVDERLHGYLNLVGPVNYVDPLFTRVDEVKIFFTKHFRYTYQQEFRLVWVPARNINKLQKIDLEIENLASECELIKLF